MKKYWFAACLLILCFVSLTFHFSSLFTQLEVDGRFHVADPDSLLFLRYYEQGLLRGEKLVYDEYGTFPNFRYIDYPPLQMSLFLHLTYFIFFLFPNLTIAPEFLIGWLPPFFGWLVGMLFLCFTWQKTRNRQLTLVVASSLIPGLVATMNSLFMRVDYHFLNCFFIWSWLFCAWKFLETNRPNWAYLGLVCATLFNLTWGGTPLFYAIIALYAVYLWLSQSSLAVDFMKFCFMTMIGSALLSMLYLIKNQIWVSAIGGLGWFQPIAILAAGVFFKILLWYSDNYKPDGKKKLALVSLAGLIGLAGVFFIFPGQFIESVTFLLKGDLFSQSIAELKPVLQISQLLKDASWLSNPFAYLGILLITFPLLLLTNPGEIFSGPGRIIRDMSLIFVLVGLHSLRYFRWLGIGVGFLSGLAIFSIFCLCRKKIFQGDRVKLKSALCLLPFFLLQFLLNYPYFYSGFSLEKHKVEAYEWIRKNTPVTSGYFDAGRPEYSFYCFWGEGNRINFYAQRPTLVNNAAWGYGKMAFVFTSESEEEAYELCKKYGIRYLYLTSRVYSNDTVRFIRAYKNRPDIPEDGYKFFPEFENKIEKPVGLNSSEQASENETQDPEEEFEKTFHYWLAYNCAIKKTGNFNTPASRLRIVYSAEQTGRMIAPKVLVYELVPGAIIQGRADPASTVKLSLECNFDKTQVLYSRTTDADENGDFAFVVPYANSCDKGRVSTAPIYKLSWLSGKEWVRGACKVSEDDVLSSNKVTPQIVDD